MSGGAVNAPSAGASAGGAGTSLLYSLTARAKQFPDAITLGRGDPDFDTPVHIRRAVQQWLEADERDRASPEVLRTQLHEAIAARLKTINGIDVDPRTEIVLTQGGQEALFVMVQAAVGPGEEIILPEPTYNSYRDAIPFAGAVKVSLNLSVEDHFVLDPDRVRAAITPKTRALVLVSPNNPTAAVLPPGDVRELAAIAEEHDLIILSDEIYDRFLYDGAVHTSPASLPGMGARTLTLNALSKSYAMTGWRLGWVAGPAEIMQQVRRIKEAVSGGTSVLSHCAGIAALTGPQEPLHEMRAAYARRRRLIMEGLDRIGLPYGTPKGGQFILVDIRPTGLSSVEFARRILEETHVLVFPGVGYGEAWGGFIRMTFLQPEHLIAEAVRRIADAIPRLA